MRIVLDTSCLITGLRSSRGAAAEVIRLLLQGRMVTLMDYKLGAEYRDVALRPEHLERSARTPQDVLDVIERLEDVALAVIVSFKPRPLSSDPNDDMVLDLAINGRADAIVTQNLKHFLPAAQRFGIAVLSPAELLNQIRKVE